MNKILLALVFALAATGSASAQYTYRSNPSLYGGAFGTGSNLNSHYVNPYTRSDGTLVGGHYQTNPNGTQFDNYGTRGNFNPYTGMYGTRRPQY